MIYCKEISILSGTAMKFPFRSQVDVVEGVVKRVWIRWEWGSACLAGCAIFRGGFQLWPTTAAQWFHSSIHETTFEENYPLRDEPLHFIVNAYNVDDTFPHRVWVAFLVLRPRHGRHLMGLMDYLSGDIPA